MRCLLPRELGPASRIWLLVQTTIQNLVICNFSEKLGLKSSTLHKALVWATSLRPPEPLWLLSEPRPAGQTRLLGCVRNQTSVFAEGIVSQEASLHGPLWSPTCCYFEPTNSHQDALWEMLFLSAVVLTYHFSLAGSTPSLLLFPDLISVSSPPLISLSLSLVHLLFFFYLPHAIVFLSFLRLLLAPSHSSSSPKHLHCNTLTQTPRGGVQLVHYVSWVFVRLMENTQNALAFHHSTGKRNSVHILPS